MEHTNVKILAISDVPSKALWDYDTRPAPGWKAST